MKKIIILLAAVAGLNSNAQSWNLSGNAGTAPGTNFIGTTDSQPLVFKTNNTEKMKITPNGRFIFFNVTSPGMVWDKNLFFGGGTDNASGSSNTAFGMGSLTQNTTGNGNTAVGNNAMSSISSGDNNVAVGQNSMRHTIAATMNVAVGMNSLEYFQKGIGNIGMGNSAMGSGSLSGDYNIGIGWDALRYLVAGNNNTVVGRSSLVSLAGGSNNIAVGSSNAKAILSGDNNIFIGNFITPYVSSPNNELNIGNWIVGNNGTIGIGGFTTQLPADGVAPDGQKYKLFVKEGIRTERVKVDIAAANGWADYVFEKDYKLMPLNDLAQFINKNGHLPEVPTTEQAIKNGIELKEMNILLLKKIEELTLYTIEQQKRIEALEKKIK
ncbi:hypothetical protein [Chryseobacterium sp. Bi04]|uniref:hypothetical protein n=1 Tax=Chryseobacterium sp. Bi04 TaxID=2822345 RepID=UPI001DE0AA36|nr:hypothetical protein [Chryseobacterium sp. Bi04]CAH0213881.1 hypothetical protein SRABI04_02293 [Chryseobacterium sp. Bi04]